MRLEYQVVYCSCCDAECAQAVHIITPAVVKFPPTDFCGFPISSVPGFRLPVYKDVVLSFGSRTIRDTIKSFQPDVVHVSSPGTLVYRTIAAARQENVPLVMSYHTNLPQYAKKFLPIPGIGKLAEFVVRRTHNLADLTLLTSPELKRELDSSGVSRTSVWGKGVNTKVFTQFHGAAVANLFNLFTNLRLFLRVFTVTRRELH